MNILTKAKRDAGLRVNYKVLVSTLHGEKLVEITTSKGSREAVKRCEALVNGINGRIVAMS